MTSWVEYHSKSDSLANEAEAASREGLDDQARKLYFEAAAAETEALQVLDPIKQRTLGITTVSTVALWYKADMLARAEQIAYDWLSKGALPDFAIEQLQELLQTIWSDRVRSAAGVRFTGHEVLVSVSGGQVVRGGAPLDLIVRKVEEVQTLFYRTAEFLVGAPHRRHGPPTQAIQELCRPWLFQAAPGSYQFAVAVEEPKQQELFPEGRVQAEQVSATFLRVVKASIDDPEGQLAELVPDNDYRLTFLKLAKNLAPTTGKTFSQLEIRSASRGAKPVTLVPGTRVALNDVIKKASPQKLSSPDQTVVLEGVLRALHLDQDWIEISVDRNGTVEHCRITEVGETVDDVLGPMVNRRVTVRATVPRPGRYVLQDIQAAD